MIAVNMPSCNPIIHYQRCFSFAHAYFNIEQKYVSFQTLCTFTEVRRVVFLTDVDGIYDKSPNNSGNNKTDKKDILYKFNTIVFFLPPPLGIGGITSVLSPFDIHSITEVLPKQIIRNSYARSITIKGKTDAVLDLHCNYLFRSAVTTLFTIVGSGEVRVLFTHSYNLYVYNLTCK
jgi:hypothetical protein